MSLARVRALDSARVNLAICVSFLGGRLLRKQPVFSRGFVPDESYSIENRNLALSSNYDTNQLDDDARRPRPKPGSPIRYLICQRQGYIIPMPPMPPMPPIPPMPPGMAGAPPPFFGFFAPPGARGGNKAR